MIGLFDSGLGGLTVIKRIRERLPHADIVFFADQANVPYGDRDAEELHGLLAANLARLDDFGADAIVMACNTSCAIAERYGWPSTRAPVLDLIDSAATAAQRAGIPPVGCRRDGRDRERRFLRTNPALRNSERRSVGGRSAGAGAARRVRRDTRLASARGGRDGLPRTSRRSRCGDLRLHPLSGVGRTFCSRTRRPRER